MKGLILKDLLNLKKYVKSLAIIIIFFAVLFISQNNIYALNGVVIILCSMMVITTMGYDNFAKWDKYALTMPVTRRDIVLSKYLLMLILTGIGVILSLLFSFGFGIVKYNLNVLETLEANGLILAVYLIFGSIILPLLYKFGVEKARILMILCFLLPTFVVIVGGKILKHLGISFSGGYSYYILKYSPIIISIIMILSLVISYIISLKIYCKKDL